MSDSDYFNEYKVFLDDRECLGNHGFKFHDTVNGIQFLVPERKCDQYFLLESKNLLPPTNKIILWQIFTMYYCCKIKIKSYSLETNKRTNKMRAPMV